MLNYVFYIQFYLLPTLLKSHKAVVCSISMHGVLIFLTSGLHSSWLIGLLIFNTICGVGAGIIVIMSTFHDTIAQCRGGEVMQNCLQLKLNTEKKSNQNITKSTSLYLSSVGMLMSYASR